MAIIYERSMVKKFYAYKPYTLNLIFSMSPILVANIILSLNK